MIGPPTMLASSFTDFVFEWYPVFGVLFSLGLLVVFVMLLRGTMGTTRPETVKAARPSRCSGTRCRVSTPPRRSWWTSPSGSRTRSASRARGPGAAGVLLYGPPGTGKTMLARAVAAHAGVDFFAASGSSFVEMFVGRGAARLRRLFKEARESGRAVVFIDELDAVGGHRGAPAATAAPASASRR